MYWYALEPLASVDARRALDLARNSKIPLLLSLMTRRVGSSGTPEALAALVDATAKSKDLESRRIILEGMTRALEGDRKTAMPVGWESISAELASSPDPQVRSLAMGLALTFGDPLALKSLRSVLLDEKAAIPARSEALASLLKARDPELPRALQRLLDEKSLRTQAIKALAAYADPDTPDAILARYPSFTPDERRDAHNTLAARLDYAQRLLAAVAENKIPSAQLTADVIRQLHNHKNKSLDEQISKYWGLVRETPADKAQKIADYKKRILDKTAKAADSNLGRSVFAKVCQQCHTLFGTGGKVGPELTGSNRADLDYVLSNVLDPSALIGKDYQSHAISTTDGRVLTGIIRAEDGKSITLATANEVLTIPKNEIEERKVTEESMMPVDIWKPLSDSEIRSLVAYLASPSQIPLLATEENATAFFNGKDLSGWLGNPMLWKVDNGEIVGKTSGLARNEFLKSEIAAEDFRLTLQVKLKANEGNSGVQFRSEALPDGEMKGYQADVGPGWWGKLYEENGRALLWDKSGEEFVKPGEWNAYEIVAKGGKIQTFINGRKCVDLDDPSGAKRGIFAFQLHSGGPTEVRFKDVKLEVNPK